MDGNHGWGGPRGAGELAQHSGDDPRTSVLQDLQSALAARLRRPLSQLYASARLYELGIDSLAAAGLKNHLASRYGATIPLSYLLGEATLDALTARIVSAGLTAVPIASPIKRVDRTGDHPLSNAQERMWFLEQLEPNRPIYNVPEVVRIQGPFDMDTFSLAIQEILRRHEVLRTTFVEVEGRPCQRIVPYSGKGITIIDLRNLASNEQDVEVRRLAEEDSVRPFNLQEDPMLRVTVLQLSGDAYVLLITMHHCAADVVSLQVFLDELEMLYAAYVGQRQPALEEPAIQYLDYAVWHRAWLGGGVQADQLGYWTSRLEGAPHTLEIPTDHPRPAVQSFRGAGVVFELDAASGVGLAELASRQGVTRFMVLAAAWQLVLHRYSRQATVLVGFPIANRSRYELEGLIGYFANTLVLRTDFTHGLTGRGLLEQVKAAALSAFDHQDVPFEEVVEAVHPPRDLSRMPLVQSMFVLNEIPQLERRIGDVSCVKVRPTTTTAKVDIALAIDQSPSGLRGEIQYSTDLFEAQTIHRMALHFQSLLSGLLHRPEYLVAELPMLTGEETTRQLCEWNSQPVPYRKDLDVCGLFDEQVVAKPAGVAVVSDRGRLTYDELSRLGTGFVHMLRGVNLQAGEPVAVYLERSPAAVAALVGIEMAGGAYVPLDPGAPIERIQWQLEDCAARVVVTDRSLRHRISAGTRTVFCVEDLSTENPKGGELSSVPSAIPAYMLYTSGSTGRPKGVVVTRGNLLHTTTARLLFYRAPVRRLLLVSPFTFDVATGALWWTLCSGGTIILASEESAQDVQYMRKMIKVHSVTHIMMVPTVYQALLREGIAEDLQSLEVVIVGGEVLTRELADAHYAKIPGARLFNEYGPTEASVWATVCEVSRHPDQRTIPIGRPIPNARAYILDSDRQLVPAGIPGELYLGGDGVAQGYLHRPDLDAKQFVPNPFMEGERLYRTGDLARYRPDGQLEFIGRIDRQIKLRGVRIEMEEVESVLAQHESVAQTVVVLRGSSPLDHRLVAYLLPASGQTFSLDTVERHARKHLPASAVPSAFVEVSEFPLLASGKVDVLALPEFPVDAGQRKIAPTNPIERAILEIWEQILPERTIGVTDNFFQLGGHSLLATQVVSRVRDVLAVEVTVRAMFEYPTIQQLARHVETIRRDSAKPTEPATVALPRNRPFPLSYSQQRMWFMYQLAPLGTAYNMPFAIRLRGQFERALCKQALEILGQRHEAFRTTFTIAQGEPAQVIADVPYIGLEEIDLRLFSEEQRLMEAKNRIESESRRPFDLAAGPLARVVFVRLAADDTVFLLHMHHVIADQWSAGILGRELVEIYNSLRREKPPVLPPLPIQYVDYAVWQRQVLREGEYDRLRHYWRQKLNALTTLSLPLDYSRPESQTFRGAGVMRTLPRSVVSGLKELSWKHGASSFMTLMACFKILLSRYSGVEDIAIGSPIANRTRTATEGLVGTLVNTLVMRTDLSGDPTFLEVLQRVKQTALEAYDHQDMPFEKLVDELQVRRDSSHSPLIQVFFNVPNAPMGDMTFEGLAVEPFDFDRGAAQFDLSLTVETEIYSRLYLEYSTELFSSSTAERLVGHYMSLLEQIVADPHAKLSALRLLTSQEAHNAVNVWNQVVGTQDSSKRVPDLISEQASRTPDHPAVRMDGRSVTYLELERQSNQWARYLVSLGVGPGSIVGLCLERSIEMVFGLLAIQKAGAAYVPLDPDYPKERLLYMVSDAEPAVLLTQDRLASLFPATQPNVVRVDCDAALLAAQSSEPVQTCHDAEALAYILYTSGSTGKPKGVEICQRSLVNFLQSMQDRPGCGADDRLLSVTTLSFDIAGLELYLPLTTGACVELVDRTVTVDGHRLRVKIDQCQPTIMQATPATWRMLLDAGWQGNRGLTALCGGEALAPDLAARLVNSVRALWNMYGPTETTIWSTLDRVEDSGAEITIGRPIANTDVYVLDKHLQIAPVGIPGELYIGGHGLARGYHKRPDLTAERFIPHPFSSDSSARLYRTGDLARYRSDGRIVHLGRLDHQVKIRGFRIELGEVQATVANHPGIAQAVVTARDDASGLKQLVAYVVPSARDLEPQAVRVFVRSSLPEYMVPTYVVFLPAFPLTPNGKVDVKALPSPQTDELKARKGLVEPSTPVEIQLAALWQQVLGVSPVGIYDNFFDLGGNSLIAVQLFAHLEQVFGRQLPLAILFQAPTIAQLAEVLNRSDCVAQWKSLVAIQPVGTAFPIFAVPGVGGNVLGFAKLATLLGREQPFFGLQAVGLDGRQTPLTTVTEIATRYLAEIRSVRPKGPYVILGTCTGGVIAFEMAQQLRSVGEQVELLILESWHPSSYESHRTSPENHWRAALRIIGKLFSSMAMLKELPVGQWGPFLYQKLATALHMVHVQAGGETQNLDIIRDRVSRATFHAVATYQTTAYAGTLLNIIASHRVLEDGVKDTRMVWAELARIHASTVNVPAENSGRLFVSPHVEVVAGVLREYLEVQRQAATVAARHSIG